MTRFDPKKNYEETKSETGFVSLNDASLKDYKHIGFKSGLEVHQQLMTASKLFCRCPAGVYHDHDDYDAEVIRHMRPTMSEMGVYDGTALMEFKTRKEITYRINNASACTYEVDDTPPFEIDREALEIAIRIALAARMNIVGEVHITRKQYLDGSIPTGFQRSAIVSVEGELSLSNKKVRLIQMSLEEDSCREVSDIGHQRIYKTDRLGMPLIETVTYPDCLTPWELAETAEHIRFLTRSTGQVRTGMGAAREDVNVSCEGGSRVEIKGVAHIKWIPALSHNEAFRQYALLNIRGHLLSRIPSPSQWSVTTREITEADIHLHFAPVRKALDNNLKVVALNLPGMSGILSHFTQPGKIFADELGDRLKVIACIEKPNMIHSEEITGKSYINLFPEVAIWLSARENDAQVIIWGPEEDIATAVETVEERIRMAFEGVPQETRKAFSDGTTIFERVLPGRDRMYPDTDSQPIAVTSELLERLSADLPGEISQRITQLREWRVPEDCWNYLLRRNMVSLVEEIGNDSGYSRREIAVILGHRFRSLEGRGRVSSAFEYRTLYDFFMFIKQKGLNTEIARILLPALVTDAEPDFEGIFLASGCRKEASEDLTGEIFAVLDRLNGDIGDSNSDKVINRVMGELNHRFLGTVKLAEVRQQVLEIVERGVIVR